MLRFGGLSDTSSILQGDLEAAGTSNSLGSGLNSVLLQLGLPKEQFAEEDLWQARFEEELQRFEVEAHRSEERKRQLESRAAPLSKQLDLRSAFALSHVTRCKMDECFDAWCTWLVQEKCRCQFGELAEDLANFKQERSNAVTEFATAKENSIELLRKVQAHWDRAGSRWTSLLQAAAIFMQRDTSLHHIRCAFFSWHAYCAHCRMARALCRKRTVWLLADYLA